ncbi:amino acid adenylation domain-containing protein, partial [Clostridium perfringens]|uniref:non-ribosomal peptide synthetase n=1 Tax=Clostridium perfringens TaxID=1502 RepID=UPI0013E36478
KIIENRDVKLKDISVISDDEKEKLIYKYNDTYVRYPRNKTVIDLFEEQVYSNPQKIALQIDNEKVTYRELSNMVDNVVVMLNENNINPNSLVGLIMEKSVEFIACVLGILKSGCTYIPIEPKLPHNRKEYIISESGLEILLVKSKSNEDYSKAKKVLRIDKIDKLCNIKVENNSKPESLAYIIYTSGSTGKPKGVMIEHKNLMNYICFASKEYYTKGLTMPLYSSIAFDLTVTTMFLPLAIGGKILIYRDDESGFILNRILNDEKSKVIKLTPAHLKLIKDMELSGENKQLKKFIVGGEKLESKLAEEIYNKFNGNIEIINEYGPTEATVGCMFYKYNPKKEIGITVPIGNAIDNCKIYILDENLRVLPKNVIGEIYIGGEGLARGYINNKKLTNERFIDNPYVKGEKIYKTGDLAIRLQNGDIEYIGRSDNQVKINGFRIELGEIEANICKINGVKNAVVLDKSDKQNNKYLCAYIVGQVEKRSIERELLKSLPQYMIPKKYVYIEDIPLTINGKVDKFKLPEPNNEIIKNNNYEGPRNKIEEKLVYIWEDILGIKGIGINDDFFDLGGDSLKSIILLNRIYKDFKVKVLLNDIFSNKTIKDLSTYIINTKGNNYISIDRCKENEFYETSSVQKRMYAMQEIEKGVAYNMPMLFELYNNIDIKKIEEIFIKLIKRHEILRTYFENYNGEIISKIDKEFKFTIKIVEYNGDLNDVYKNFVKEFDLGEAPLYRVILIKNNNKNYLFIDIHHIIADGISVEILIKEFMDIYDGKKIIGNRIQYKDFAKWQNKSLKSEEMINKEEYWKKTFKDEIPILDLPYDFERPIIKSFEGSSIEFYIDEDMTTKIRKLAKNNGSTVHMVLLSSFIILLSKYSNQEKIVTGIPVSGREHPDVENIVGTFINTIPVLSEINNKDSYLEFLNKVKLSLINAYDNQSCQFERIIEILKIDRNSSRNPLFDVMFNMLDSKDIDKLMNNRFEIVKLQGNISKFDLTLNAIDKDKKLYFIMEFCNKLFKLETIKRLEKSYLQILDSICKDATIKISEVEVLTEKDKNKILNKFNRYKYYQSEKTIQELFKEQVIRNPDKIAIEFMDKALTYKELDDKSNKLAAILNKNGAKREKVIGILIERSIDMMIAIIGVLKSGAAYLPIDCKNPEDRIDYIIKDSSMDILITNSRYEEYWNNALKVINIDNEYIDESSACTFNQANELNDLAYVIYTSGSTGNPKGVMVEHRQLSNFISSISKEINFYKCNSILCSTTISFDIFILEALIPLTFGLKVIVLNEEQCLDGNYIAEVIEKNNVDIMQSTPSKFKMMLSYNNFRECIKLLKNILIGGEEFTESLYKEIERYAEVNFYNLYGPTETTIWSTCKRIKKNHEINIGRPLNNTRIYILDKNNKVLPIGVKGEICIGGNSIARGYVNNKLLTVEKFIDNPYVKGEKIYKTGDLGKWTNDGELECSGRVDNQVKINGVRIELGEIENKLREIEGIENAIVIDKYNNNNEKYLCAYIISNLSTEIVKKSILKKLPIYMIPTQYTKIKEIPLNINGKIDKKMLIQVNNDLTKDVLNKKPKNQVEKELINIWRDILSIENISINDNFFSLGGTSLSLIKLAANINKKFNINIPIKDLFENLTIESLSDYINSSSKTLCNGIKKCKEKLYYEASPAQKRMYIIQELEDVGTSYNIPIFIELLGSVNINKIKSIFSKIVEIHEVFRTSFDMINGSVIQKIHTKVDFKVEFEKCINGNGIELEKLKKDFIKKFDLSKAPLIRVKLLQLNSRRHILMIDVNHIIFDGESLKIIIKEFEDMYNGKKIINQKIDYKDYSEWINYTIKKSNNFNKQKDYWINKLSGKLPILNITNNYKKNKEKSFNGNKYEFNIKSEILVKLRDFSLETNTTMFMILLSIINILLSKYSNQEDILIGTPISGRNNIDINNLVGMFVNTLVMRNIVNADKSYYNFLKEVKKNCIEAYENQDYQFDDLVKILDINRYKDRKDIFDVMFVMNDTSNNNIKLDGIECKIYDIYTNTAKFPLTFIAQQDIDKLNIIIEYCRDIFDDYSIKKMSERFIKCIEQIVSDKYIKIKDIEFLNEDEINIIENNINEACNKLLGEITF